MCCRTNVFPLDRGIACAILALGEFTPTDQRGDNNLPLVWVRNIPEEGTSVTVSLADNTCVAISISPSISAFGQHLHKRIAASVCFEIAAKYAEKVGGEIIQRGAVQGCRPIGQSGDLLLARYPSEPLDWDHICLGFRQEMFPEGFI